MSTHEEIESARGGDPRAISRLLMEYRGIVAAVVVRLVDGTEQRKDAVQNVFLKAIKGIAGFNGRCRFSTWLYRIAVNECVDTMRKAAQFRTPVRVHDSEVFRDLNAPDGFSHTSDSELREDIRSSVAALPIDQKTAFSLFYFGGYSGREGAEAMRITEANFFVKLKQARDTVRRDLKRSGWGR